MAGKVTAIESQKRNRNRVNVYLDGQFAFALDDMEASRLEIGQWLDDSSIQAIEMADERHRSHQRALNFLSYRPRSSQEVQRNLSERDFSAATIEATLGRLEEANLVDDLEFARYWVEQREHFRPRSIAMLRHELRQKGISSELIATALETVDEETSAYQAARQWARRSSNLPRDELRRKLSSFLARRGFPYSVVRETLDRLEDDLDLNQEQPPSLGDML